MGHLAADVHQKLYTGLQTSEGRTTYAYAGII